MGIVIVVCGLGGVSALAEKPSEKIVGMYVHQHWPYKHPYAARTWTLQDWRGYADGLHKLGYNTILVWPVIETMPTPPMRGDLAYLAKLAKVIDMLHNEFGMRVYLALCPNVGVNSTVVAKSPFEKRHFFYCDTRVNPADPVALKQLIATRERFLAPLAKADGVSIIDSDPGGFAGSTNADFVNLLAEHRKMLDRLRPFRPGMELDYWMHVGWEAYSRFYATGRFAMATAAENESVLQRLKELNPEPWGLANGLDAARKLGLESRVISFSYGYIEGEPSFPLTNFGGDAVVKGGASGAPRGVMGNAQTHCIQLPNTFAFARGATGKSAVEADYVQFADDLIAGAGQAIVKAWHTLAGTDPRAMRDTAEQLEAVSQQRLTPGPLQGLLFGDPRRFLTDLVMQLQMKGACEAFCAASEGNQDIHDPFRAFVAATKIWQDQHGYQNRWYWPRLQKALRKLNSPVINAVLDQQVKLEGDAPFEHIPGDTPFARIQNGYRIEETFAPELILAMERAEPPPPARP